MTSLSNMAKQPSTVAFAPEVSSFKKRSNFKKDLIKGTCPSLHGSQLLISSGISSFDEVIGGGLPVGSVVLINEDEYGNYAKLMLKYFVAEGIVSQHSIYFAAQDISPEDLINDLPAPVDADTDDDSDTKESDEKMTIAWRYKNLKTVSFKSTTPQIGHSFDLLKTMNQQTIQKSDITTFPNKEVLYGETFDKSMYCTLLKSIEEKLNTGFNSGEDTNSNKNILRIALFRMNSPFWQSRSKENSEKNLLLFLYSLRGLIRNSFATCCITLPFSSFRESLLEKCIHLADISIKLVSFAGTKYEKVSPYKDCHGFFEIQKSAPINGLTSYNPQSSNFVFKLRRKKLVIETFNLPPALEETTEREQDESFTSSCGSKSNKLDF